MKNKKKDLAKIALTAFMLSAAMPAAGNANIDAQSQGTLLAGGGCGAASSNQPASGTCGASSQARRSPATSGCGASSSQSRTPAHSGCGASSRPTNNTPATHGCGASSYSPKNTRPAEGMRAEDNMGYMNDSDASSYQGTTTGPGPNGGYPGAPHGSYNSNR